MEGRPHMTLAAAASAVLGVLALAALVASPATAVPESQAPTLDPRIIEAGHSPAIVQPHTQWQGFLRVRPDARVVSATYQVCQVGKACFAPPAPARDGGDGVYWFDTRNYTVAGPDGAHAVDYQAGWHLGVKWRLTDATGNTTEIPASHCSASDGASCAESEYLTLEIAAAPPSGIPGPAAPAIALLLVALATFVAARRHDA